MDTNSRFSLRLEPGAPLVYDRRTHQYYELSAPEADLLSEAQRWPLARAAERVARRHGAGAADRAFADLADLGTSAELFAAPVRVVRLRAVPGARGAPLVAHLGLTTACNFACAHCYSRSGKRSPGELTLRELRALVDDLSAMGCQKLVLGGGEPFLRRDLPALVAHADRHGIDSYVHTNGAALGPAALRSLAEHPPAGLAVSLDGATGPTNDAVRGAGAFRRALEGVRRLRREYPPGFNLSMAVGPGNASEAARMAELAARLGARVLLLRPTYPAGQAAGAAGLACDRRTFARASAKARKAGRRQGLEVDAPAVDRAAPPDFEGFGCVAGRIAVGITPTGEVSPCLNLPEGFVAGNVRQRPLLELWRTAKVFRTLRSQRACRECAACADYDACRGGCRVRALHSGRGLGGPDTWCRHAV